MAWQRLDKSFVKPKSDSPRSVAPLGSPPLPLTFLSPVSASSMRILPALRSARLEVGNYRRKGARLFTYNLKSESKVERCSPFFFTFWPISCFVTPIRYAISCCKNCPLFAQVSSCPQSGLACTAHYRLS